MSADDLTEFYVHTVDVEMFLGTSGYGEEMFAPAVTLSGMLEGARHLVRSSTGEQVISESSFYTYPVNVPAFTTGSRVTATNGDISTVITVAVFDLGEMDMPDNAVISLT